MLLAKIKLNIIEVLISKTLVDSCNNDDQFLLVSNVLKEHNEIKKEIKFLENFVEYTIQKWLI